MNTHVPTRGIHDVALVDGERIAIVHGDRRVTYQELDWGINRMAHAFQQAGVEPGDRVAVLVGNRPELFMAWNGAARLGALVVPIPTRATTREAGHLIQDSGAKALVHDAGPSAGDLAVLCDAAWDVDALARSAGPDSPPASEYLGASVVTMNYTSGTSGAPKGIVRPPPEPARHYEGNAFMRFWEFGVDDVHLLCGPGYHTAPGAYAQMHLMEGARVVVVSRFDASDCLHLIEVEQVTNSHMVPANFVRILGADWRRYDLTSVRKILHAAAPCPIPVKRQILDVFPPDTVWEYYGMSEGMASVISPGEWLAKPGSVGRAFPGLHLKILDEDGAALSTGEVGLIYVSVVPGYRGFRYHNDDEKTSAAWRGDFYTVGDLGSLDDDGYLTIADRRTDLIIRGGVNIYPTEVENALAEHPAVVDAAVLGLPDDDLGQRVHTVVELRPGAARDADALAAHLRQRVAPYKVPASFEFVAELPREPNGKVRKRELRDARVLAVDPPARPSGPGWEPEIAELRQRLELARQMGGEEKVARHHRAGRLTVRERIESLADPGSFHEIGGLAGRADYDGGHLRAFVPANFVTGRIRVDGRPVVVAGDDFTVRGGAADGSVFGKQLFAEQMANELRIPIVRLVDGSGGGGSVRSLNSARRTYLPTDPSWRFVVENLSTVPVVALALGSVAGQGAARAVTSHYSVMVRGTSAVFVAGPPVVARTGEQVDTESLGGRRGADPQRGHRRRGRLGSRRDPARPTVPVVSAQLGVRPATPDPMRR